jgi:hypothetical protein
MAIQAFIPTIRPPRLPREQKLAMLSDDGTRQGMIDAAEPGGTSR